MKIKTIFVIQGYESEEDEGRLKNVVTFEIYAKDQAEALAKAKAYIEKSYYRVSSVIEK